MCVAGGEGETRPRNGIVHAECTCSILTVTKSLQWSVRLLPPHIPSQCLALSVYSALLVWWTCAVIFLWFSYRISPRLFEKSFWNDWRPRPTEGHEAILQSVDECTHPSPVHLEVSSSGTVWFSGGRSCLMSWTLIGCLKFLMPQYLQQMLSDIFAHSTNIAPSNNEFSHPF